MEAIVSSLEETIMVFSVHLQNLRASDHCGGSCCTLCLYPLCAGYWELSSPRNILYPFHLADRHRHVVTAGGSEPRVFLHWRNHFYSFSKIQLKRDLVCLFILFLYITASLESVGTWLLFCVHSVPSCGYSQKSERMLTGL